jgi:P-type Ca2+ transporter type 2C
VPADARVLEADDMMLDESMLTGESVPVDRSAHRGAERKDNLVRVGTLVVSGHGTAEVTAISMDTAVGRIGMALRTLSSPPTPMQLEIRRAVIGHTEVRGGDLDLALGTGQADEVRIEGLQ